MESEHRYRALVDSDPPRGCELLNEISVPRRGYLTARFWHGRPHRPLKQYSFDIALGYAIQLDDKTLLLKTPAHRLNNIEKSAGTDLEASSLLAGLIVPEGALPATRGETLSTVGLQPTSMQQYQPGRQAHPLVQ